MSISNSSSNDYLLSRTYINYLTYKKVYVNRFQSKKFVFTVQRGIKRHKIFQIVFGKSDGSLYVTFPYFQNQKGILSTGTIPRFLEKGNVNLQEKGKVTSHLVKYAHHPDGQVHFSQDGKIRTSVKRQSLPLKSAEGHLFTINLQDLSSFDTDSVADDRPPKKSRTTLNFKFHEDTPAIKFVARWYKPETFLNRSKIKSKKIGPTIQTQTPGGNIQNAFMIGPLSGWPLDDFVLLINCEGIPALGKKKEPLMLFIGGFDPPSNLKELDKPFSFLCASYPVSNYETLVDQIGSTDLDSFK